MALENKQINIVAFGDSLTEGYNKRGFKMDPYTIKLSQLLQDYGATNSSTFKIINTGYSGERTSSMVSRVKRVVSNFNKVNNDDVHYLFLLGGTNDISESDAESISNRIISIHQWAHQKNIKTAVITIPQMVYDGEHYAEEKITQINDTLIKFANENEDNCFVVDFYNEIKHNIVFDKDKAVEALSGMKVVSMTAEEETEATLKRRWINEGCKDKYWDDGIHLTPFGYSLLGAAIFRQFKAHFLDKN